MTYDIVIVGGGMAGQAFALSMAKTDYKIAIIEPNSPSPTLNKDFHTRVSAITPSSEQLLKDINAWGFIKRKYAFSHTQVWDQNSHGTLDFHAHDENLPHLGYIIENDAIQSALFGALEKTDIKFIGTKLENIEKTTAGYQLQLNNKQSLDCQLLIGADGARSNIRNLANISFSENNYQQKAIICNVKSTQSFNNTTWQRFLSDSIVALLPLGENQASIVWSADNDLADELMALDKPAFAKRLSAAVEYRFGEFEVLSDIQSFPLIERSSNEYVKESLALIGDAAHNIHPLAGQGINLGFSDVRELSKQLEGNNKNLGNYLTLRKYARARRLDNELMAKTMTGLNWIYKENNEPLRWLRGFGMNIINENPMLKSFLQKHALGNS